MKTQLKYASVLVGFLITAGAFAQTLQEAIRYTDNENYSKAKTAFRALLAKEPTNGDNYYYFGDLLLKTEDPDSARIIFQKGVDINATNPIVHIGMARNFMVSGKADEGMKEIAYAKSLVQTEAGKKGGTMTPQRQALMNLEMAKTLLLAPAPDFQAAIDLVTVAMKLDPKNPETQLTMGDVLFKKDPVNATPAINCYLAASKLDAKSNKAYLRIGNIYFNGGNLAAATSYYNLALKIDSTYAPAYRARGEAQFQNRRADSASISFEKYLKLNPDCYARYRYSAALYKNKEYDKSIAQAMMVLGCDSSIAVVYRIIARCYAEKATPDATKGAEFMTMFFVQQKKFGKPHLLADDYIYRAKCYSKNNQDSLAILDYQAGYNLDTNRRDVFFDMGTSYFKLKKYDLAAASYSRKINANPGKAAIADYNALGRALFLNKDYIHADSAFRKITLIDPKLGLGWFWRGRTQAQLDPDIKSDSARKFYEIYYDIAILDKEKNKKDLATAAKYLGGYHYVKKNFGCARAYFQLVLELDPTQTDVKSELDTDKDLKVAKAADISTCKLPK